MTEEGSRSGKQQAVRELSRIAGIAPPDSAGGTIPRAWLEQLIRQCLGGDTPEGLNKADLLRFGIERLGGTWDDSFVTESGSTVTGEAAWALVDLLTASRGISPGNQEGEIDNDDIEPTEPEDAKEDLETQLAKIADDLSFLADSLEVPQGYRASHDPFEPGEVTFTSNSWLARVLQVQAWLHLDDEITRSAMQADAAMAARRLFELLGTESPDSCIDCTENVVTLTATGADLLSSRLDTSTRLATEYVSARESETRRSASEAWSQAWDDEHPAETIAEPIRAETKTWYISQFAGFAEKGRLNLTPSYQRGDVWPTGDAQKLIESILRGIPLPSIIILKPHGQGAQAVYEVVDGKQRLTSILRFIGRHPEAKAHARRAKEAVLTKEKKDINFPSLLQTNYKKFRRLWKAHMGEALTGTLEAKYYFPFRLNANSKALVGPLARLAGKYYCEIKDAEIVVGEGPCAVGDVFEEQVSSYQLPLIQYLDATPRQIHEVFNLYNRQGKKLTAEEIRNALYHEVDLARLLLVAAGDYPYNPDLLPFVEDKQESQLAELATLLTDYKFGVSRYKRTKVLCWLTALLLQPALSNGSLSIRSTAKHIDELFESISKSRGGHRLARAATLRQLIDDLHTALNAHASCDSWHDRFKDDKDGQKWQELQLVSSLLGVMLIGIADANVLDTLDDHADAILEFTAAHPRPEKTQNRTQWAYIGKVSLGLVEVVGADLSTLGAELERRYGSSCLATLEAAAHAYAGQRTS